MVEQFNRIGKKGGQGFYDYPQGGKKSLWPELPGHFPLQGEELAQDDMMTRLMFIQALEAIKCLQENVVTTVGDANIGSIFGWGFAPFKGGVLQYVNDYGVKAFVAKTRELAEKYGDRFAPPAKLLEIAENDQTF